MELVQFVLATTGVPLKCKSVSTSAGRIAGASPAGLISLALAVWPVPARGDSPQSSAAPEEITTASSAPLRSHAEQPEWRRVQTWEYPLTGAALLTALYLRFLGPQVDVNWRGGILFDDAIIDRMGTGDLDQRQVLSVAGHVLFGASMAYRVLDSLILPLAADDTDLALQLSMTDLEAFSTVAIVLWGSQALVARERPVVSRRCQDPEFAREIGECDPDDRNRNRSFIAGHPATVLTSAGVTCLHHNKLRLYGGSGDTIACGAMIGATGLMSLQRLVTEVHYPSDLVLGLGIGAFSGWVVPLALRYGLDGDAGGSVALLPWPGPGQTGVQLMGSLR